MSLWLNLVYKIKLKPTEMNTKTNASKYKGVSLQNYKWIDVFYKIWNRSIIEHTLLMNLVLSRHTTN